MPRVVAASAVPLRRSGRADFDPCPDRDRLGLTSGWPPQSPATFFMFRAAHTSFYEHIIFHTESAVGLLELPRAHGWHSFLPRLRQSAATAAAQRLFRDV